MGGVWAGGWCAGEWERVCTRSWAECGGGRGWGAGAVSGVSGEGGVGGWGRVGGRGKRGVGGVGRGVGGECGYAVREGRG